MSFNRMLNTTADLYRASVSRGDAGGVVKTFGIQTSGFPCRISIASPAERIAGDTQFAEATGVVYVASTEDIVRGDEIRRDAEVYEVLGVRDPSVENHHREVVVKEEERAG